VDVAQRNIVARTSNIAVASGAGRSEALVLDVAHPGRPALRVEVAGSGLFALCQNDTVVLMAQRDRDHCGVEYASTGRFRSPVPPTRAVHAARIGTEDATVVRQARWAYHFAAALTRSAEGPLHAGRWVLSTEASHLRTTDRWDDLLLPGARGCLDWFTHNGGWQILPLRQLSDPGAGRVKAYRKQARDGILAPVLLWWISGLDCYVVVDGHDRLVAALSENVQPPVLSLSSVSTEEAARAATAFLHRYARTAEALDRQVISGTPGAANALATVNRRLADDLGRIETAYAATRAWPLPGGTARWNAWAAAHLAEWHTEMTRI
jgi:hypothetical protein